MIQFSPDQKRAMDRILAWTETGEKRLSLGGYAGTGKTTIISELLKIMQGRSIRVCAPTGKAANVLRRKGVYGASTLHKLIYVLQMYCPVHGVEEGISGEEKGKRKRCSKCKRPLMARWINNPFIDAEFVIVDEASMLNLSMVEDIEEMVPKILYVGDHGQLEPIGKDPGIMRSPDIRLEEIHRQAAQSGIIQLAHHMRRGSRPHRWDSGGATDAQVVPMARLAPKHLNQFDVILCGYNKTRKAVNRGIRKLRGFHSDMPEVGERIICLQNDSELGIFNGQLFKVRAIRESYEYPKLDLVDEAGNEYFDISAHPDQFQEEKKIDWWTKGIGLFDFGYCLTTHKSQGSEWDSVGVIEQIARSWDPARWRYTAATRAAKNLEYWVPKGR